MLDGFRLDERIASELVSGSHQLTLEATDEVGNKAIQQVDFFVSDDFLVGADGSAGWGVRSSDTILLGEQDSFVVESEVPISLGPQGNRTLSFDVLPQFDTSDIDSAFDDLFLVYLVDPTDPTRTLIDGGVAGTPLFTLDAMGRSDYRPGLVRFNGTRVDVDVSLLPQTDGLLRFQLIGGDQDAGSFVQVTNLASEVDSAGVSQSLFPIQVLRSEIGDELQLGDLNEDENIEIVLGLPALDTSTGKYAADLRVRSDQGIKSRQVAVVLRDVPNGVQLDAISGVDGEGNPYISFANAIGPAGLAAGELSHPVRVTFDNPDLLRMPIGIAALVGQPNQPPSLEAIEPLSLIPGDVVSIALDATDPDGDIITFGVIPGEEMPTTNLLSDGTLIIAPTPDQVGTYEFTVSASDGAFKSRQAVSVNVTADPLTSTRIKGQILDVDGTALQGMTIELGGVQGVTDADGVFKLDVGSGPLVSDTLRIRGDTFTGSDAYPFIAEKLPLVLEHEVFEGSLNTVHRPIYLPKLNVAGGTVIDPTVETTVTQEIAPGEMATVTVAASSLMNQQGTPFEGTLSITEVPPDFTPAALPVDLSPATVVTIQPGEMVFASPAPLTLPNRAEWAPGTEMDLWAINPTTGDFEIVGQMIVSSDGERIETVSGGIRYSSWIFPAPPPPPGPDDGKGFGPDDGCTGGKSGGDGPGGDDDPPPCGTKIFTSTVDLQSGAVIETHDLVSYQSLGTERGVTLVYDSLEADPRPIVSFGYDNVPINDRSGMFGSVTITDGTMTESVRGIWRTTTDDANGAVQVDLSEWPSGQIPYTLRIGLGQLAGNDPGDRLFTGTTESFDRSLAHVNRINSPFGAGWSISGMQQIVENADGSALLINGNNTASLFSPPETEGGPYQSPAGDFSTLTKDAAGQFTRTFPDQSVSRFNDEHLLVEFEDRQGRISSYDYDADGRLITITDPVGLQTTFEYADGMVTITDPVNRVTELELDDSGNLVKITDPDQTSRRFEYDAKHHMVGETDQRGHTETTLYDQYGRATQAIRKDGSVRRVSPAQTQVEISQGESSFQNFSILINGEIPTFTPLNAKVRDSVSSQFVDANGNVEVSGLNPIGLPTQVTDGEGVVGSTTYNDDNLPSIISDGRGNTRFLRYDDRGNVVETTDSLVDNVGFWVGSESGDWSDANNWSLGRVPGPDDDVVLDAGDGVLEINASIPTRINVRSLSVGANGSSVSLNLHRIRLQSSLGTIVHPTGEVNYTGNEDNSSNAGNGISGPFLNKGTVRIESSGFSAGRLLINDAQDFDNRGLIQLIKRADSRNSHAALMSASGTLVNGPEGTIEFLREGTRPNNVVFGAEMRIETDFINQGVVRIDNTVARIRDTQWTNEGLIDILPGADLLMHNSHQLGSSPPELMNEGVIRVPDGAKLMVSSGAIFHPKNGRFDKLILGNRSFGTSTLGEGTNRDEILVYGESFVSGQFVNAESGRITIAGNGLNLPNPGTNTFGTNASLSIVDGTQFQNFGRIKLTSETSSEYRGSATLKVQAGALINSPTGVIELSRGVGHGNSERSIDGEFINQGTVRFVDESLIVRYPWTNTGVIDVTENSNLFFRSSGGSDVHLVNDGIIRGTANFVGGAKFSPAEGQFDRVRIQSPSVLGSGTNHGLIDFYNVHAGGSKVDGDFTNGSDGIINIVGTSNRVDGAALLHIEDASNFENQGLIRLTSETGADRFDGATLSASGGAIVNASGGIIESLTSFNGEHRIIDAPVFNKGVLRAVDGSITFADQLTNAGEIQIGRSESLNVTSGLQLTDESTVMIEVDGANGNMAGQLLAGASPTLAGELNLVAANGATFSDQRTFTPVTYTDLQGQFDAIITTNLAETITIDPEYADTGLRITATVPGIITPPDPPPVNPFDEFRDLVDNPPGRPDLSDSFGTAVQGDRTRDPIEDPIFPPAGPASFQLNRSTTRLTYDPQFNQLTRVIDPLGRQRLFELDPDNGNTLTSIEVIGLPDSESAETDDLVTTYTYTALDQIDTVTDPLGRITDFDYDAFGRTVLTTIAVGTPDEAAVQFAYDDAGNLTELTDENGNTTSFSYDMLNRLTGITEPDPDGDGPLLSPVTTFAYDARGNLESTTDAAGSTSRSVYDTLDRLVQQIDDDDNLLQFQYDAKGNLLTTIDPLGNVTRNVYDTRDRLIESVDPDGGVTSFTYDAASNLTSLTDPVGNETTFSYDVRNRLISEIDPLGNAIGYEYDLVDNLIRKTDRNDRVTEFAYDDVDRLVRETWLNVDATVANQIDYSYDAASNLLSVDDAFSALAFTYDARDRAAQVDNAGTPGAPNVVLDYTYDGVGNVLSVTDTIEGDAGATTSYLYDALNRQTQITQTGDEVSAKRVDLVYNALGQFASIDRFSDLDATQPVVRTAYTYDALNRLVDLRHSNATEDVAFYEYTYDSSSRITSINDIDGLTSYRYDDRDQLTAADRAAGDIRGDESYTYDSNGNRIQSHLHNEGYVTGEANRLLSDGTYDYEYDNEGNMTRRTEIASGDYRVFQWDHRNRLIAVNDFAVDDTPVQEVAFSYDAFGRRISKSVDSEPTDSVGAAVTHFVHDVEDVILDFVVQNVGDSEEAALDRRYLHGPLIDQIFAQEDRSGSLSWLTVDHLGSSRQLVDSDGLIQQTFYYDSFGRIVIGSAGADSIRYLYAGREYDEAMQLYFNRARFYEPVVGRFLSEDPIRFDAGDANLYRYVTNEPLLKVDPFGLCEQGGVKKDPPQKLPTKQPKKPSKQPGKVDLGDDPEGDMKEMRPVIEPTQVTGSF